MRKILLSVVICLGLGVPGRAMAEPPAADEIAVRMVSDYVIPHYADLAVATEMQRRSWQDGCDDPETLRAAYHDVADAWAGTYFWNTGPITLLLRHDRFYHWPERRNAVGRGMTALLASEDEARLAPQHFATDSVAVQGLAALEYLLFSKANVQNNDYACKVGQAIAVNLNEIAQGTAVEWQDKVLPLLEAGQPHPLYFDDAQELANNLYTDYLAGFTIIKDQKVLAVMGASADQARPKKAEAARSDRSLRNIIVNLDGLAEYRKNKRPIRPSLAALTTTLAVNQR